MSDSLEIRPLVIGQYDEVYALWERCEGVGLSSADARENIARYLERNPEMSFVALEKGDVVGAILCGHDGRRGYIHHLAVDETMRRQGIGARLAARCLAALEKEGIQKCHLFIFHENAGGMAFWEAIGWTLRQDIGVMSRYVGV